MSYIHFQDVLAMLGKRVNFDSISNLFGRTVFDKKGGEAVNKMIHQANPLVKQSTTNSAAVLLSMPGAMTVIESGSNQKEQGTKALGDMSWFEEYLK